MIVVDVNLLLYAHFRSFPEHTAARRWWEGLLNGSEQIGLCAPALFGFVRLATSRRVFVQPMAADAAVARCEQWLARPQVRWLVPGPRHVELAFGLLRELGTAGNLTTDVQLAAFAIEHGAELHSNDADFARFKALEWSNPLHR